MKKEVYLWGFLLLFVFAVFGCTAPVSETSQEPVKEETNGVVATIIPEGSSSIEANKQTEAASPQQDIILNQSALQETNVQETQIQKPACSREFSPQFNAEPYYSGHLFDAHFHMPNLIDYSTISGEQGHGSSTTDPVLGKDIELGKILCNFDKENVVGVIGFAIGAEQLLEETLKAAHSIKKDSAGKIRLFLMPFTFEAERLDEIQADNPYLFAGYGEIAFYFEGNPPPNSEEMIEIYRLAEKHNLIVMAHPDGRQESEIEAVIRQNPNVKFLIHGPEAEDYITDLMKKYPNVYYSIDAILIRLPHVPGALMYMVSGKEEFKLQLTQNFDTLLNDAVNKWKDRIEQHPDRFMWGTDRAHKWTYDGDVSVLLEEFGRAFIGKLDPAVQEKFALTNAQKLFQKN